MKGLMDKINEEKRDWCKVRKKQWKRDKIEEEKFGMK